MSPLTVAEIWRYPVKSVGGEQLQVAQVTETGIVGDRGWGIFDTATSTVLTARRAPELLFASAAIDGDGVAITLPGLPAVHSNDPEIDASLSNWLGRAVVLTRAGDQGGTYEVPMDFENDAEWVSWQGPAQAWHDSETTRVSLVSRASLGDWHPARFRKNLILDGSGEDELVGTNIKLGESVLEVTKRVTRCVIVTRPQPDLDRDLDVLREINSNRDQCLGIGAAVKGAGTIRAGDQLGPAA